MRERQTPVDSLELRKQLQTVDRFQAWWPVLSFSTECPYLDEVHGFLRPCL